MTEPPTPEPPPQPPTLTEVHPTPLPDLDHNFYWPHGDLRNGGIHGWGAPQWVEKQIKDALYFTSLVPAKQRHTAVCAGAHIGIMPITYERMGFQSVLAFEPDPQNFGCLLRNCQRYNTIRTMAMQSALGRTGSTRWLAHNTANSGASCIAERATLGGEYDALQRIDVVMLDQFNLKALDLLQLDAEGYEYHILEGAINTIRQHRPIIVIEMNGLSDRYGVHQHDIISWLASSGYTEAKRYQQNHDRVFHWRPA